MVRNNPRNRNNVQGREMGYVARAGAAQRNRVNNREDNQGVGAQVRSLAISLLKTPGTYAALLAVMGASYAGYRGKTIPLSQPQVKVPQPAAPKVPEHIMKLDYSKGDDASSLEELTRAVGKDYTITPNELAKDPSSFEKGQILVMGEDHRNARLPGIPGGRGAVLLESEDPNRCLLPKYTQDPSNVCEHIDKGKKVIDKKLMESMTDIHRTGDKLLSLIDPSVMGKLKANVNAQQSVWLLFTAMSDYSHQHFDQAFGAANNKEKQALLVARDEFHQAINGNNQLVSSTAGFRDKAMIEEATKVIKNLDDDAGAAVVVGDLHADPIAKKLAQEFPDRPVVRLKPKDV
jgi:hypothetical protein